jgi:dihydrolipoamide dehydrogenase
VIARSGRERKGDRVAIETDVAIIGGGPGGYVAAIRAAQLGARAVLIEKEFLGGTCTNWGCIPSKALLDSAARFEVLKHAQDYGLQAGSVGYDWAQIQGRKQRVVQQLRGGVETLVKGNGITLLRGVASFQDAHRLGVRTNDGQGEEVSARSVVIATGSVEGRLPIPGLNLPGVFGSTAGLETSPPKSLVIIGGGAIGVEFATMFSAFGTQVTVVEMLETLVPLEDAEIGRALAQQFQRRGIQVRTGTRLEQVREAEGGGLETVVTNASGTEALRAEKVMVAVGRAPYTEGLGLERLGLEMNKRFIKVDARLQTNVPGIYAIGDVAGGALAHVAMAQGEVAVENILGHESEMDYRAVPSVTFCTPQIASAGLTEEKARATGQELKVGRYPFVATPKAVVVGDTAGFIKIVADAKYEQVLGVHMIGPEVTDLIAEAALAIMMEATVEDIARTIHAHPTLPEGFKEAALDVDQRAIHIMRRRRST